MFFFSLEKINTAVSFLTQISGAVSSRPRGLLPQHRVTVSPPPSAAPGCPSVHPASGEQQAGRDPRHRPLLGLEMLLKCNEKIANKRKQQNT